MTGVPPEPHRTVTPFPSPPRCRPADRTPGNIPVPAGPIIAGMIAGFDGLRFRHWQVEARADGVVVVTIDREGQAVNALSQAMLVELGELLEDRKSTRLNSSH